MLRTVVVTMTAAMLACATPPQQQRSPAPIAPVAFTFPNLPSALDLDAVPIGSWAAYEQTFVSSVSLRMTVAVVGRSTAGTVVETTRWGQALGNDMVVTATVQKGGRPVGLVVTQVNDKEPVASPADAATPTFSPPVPGPLIAVEQIRVLAGMFTANHHGYTTPNGDDFDAWMNETVPPLGLVKLQSNQRLQAPRVSYDFRYELVAFGSDAKPRITRPAKRPK